MNIFPIKEKAFKLIDDKAESMNRLSRRTETSENLTSQLTEKSFRGVINGNQFKLISSVIGTGAFCVMTGEINSEFGFVKVEIHKVFKILLSIFLLFPLIGITIAILTGSEAFSPVFILVVIFQMLIIRYVFIGIAFKHLSNTSLSRLRDVLDFEWVKK
jgi:ABC-type dipeptide/oligopeptide/nickel transport system permease subunit